MYSCQLVFGEGSGEFILVGNVGPDVLLGTEFSCLGGCDELGVELGPEDVLRRSEVVSVDSIRHERSVGSSRGKRDDGVLARCSLPYMCIVGGPRIFELPYRFRGMYVLVINPLVVRVWISLPFDEILLLASSAELPRVQNLLNLVFFLVIDEVWSWSRII